MDQQKLRADLYLSFDTIAAPITAVGGAVCIVRVSGPGVSAIIQQLCGRSPDELIEREATLMRLRFDEALVTFFKGPRSFTGEDVLEFQLHGNSLIVTQLLEELSSLGVRAALPGEFSFRAVRNGKLTLTQAKAVSDLIAAQTESGIECALERLAGGEGDFWRKLGSELKAIAVQAELAIDFSDQDNPEQGLSTLKAQVSAQVQMLRSLLGTLERGRRLQEGIRVALVGAPNAGKSSLFNALLCQDRAIVTPVAGTTRDLVSERLTLCLGRERLTIRLEDTAGIRRLGLDDVAETQGVERATWAARTADILLACVAPLGEGAGAESVENALEAVVPEKCIGVLTKSDLGGLHDRARALLKARGIQTIVSASALSIGGTKDVIEAVLNLSRTLVQRQAGEHILMRAEEARAVANSIAALERGLLVSTVELLAADLRAALAELAPVLGETTADTILEDVFSKFCIGK